jgi:hypothetical protein
METQILFIVAQIILGSYLGYLAGTYFRNRK